MLKQVLPACLLAAALVAANGCCCSRPLLCHGSAVAETCATGDCGECASCGVGAPREQYLLHGAHRASTCGAGCGGMYWGDWISYPPSCGESCGGCADWACDSCCGPWHLLSGLRSLWGYRYRACGCGEADCDGSCSSCGVGSSEGLPMEALPHKAGEKLSPPTPEPEPAPAKKARETSYRYRQASYAQPLVKSPARPTTVRTVPAPSRSQPAPSQPEESAPRDITR